MTQRGHTECGRTKLNLSTMVYRYENILTVLRKYGDVLAGWKGGLNYDRPNVLGIGTVNVSTNIIKSALGDIHIINFKSQGLAQSVWRFSRL